MEQAAERAERPAPRRPAAARPARHPEGPLPLSALLSRVLLSFALEYEREAELSLAVGANVLRVLAADGTRPRDLPALTGTASVRRPATLPYYPMVMHRGGYPDGS